MHWYNQHLQRPFPGNTIQQSNGHPKNYASKSSLNYQHRLTLKRNVRALPNPPTPPPQTQRQHKIVKKKHPMLSQTDFLKVEGLHEKVIAHTDGPPINPKYLIIFLWISIWYGYRRSMQPSYTQSVQGVATFISHSKHKPVLLEQMQSNQQIKTTPGVKLFSRDNFVPANSHQTLLDLFTSFRFRKFSIILVV